MPKGEFDNAKGEFDDAKGGAEYVKILEPHDWVQIFLLAR